MQDLNRELKDAEQNYRQREKEAKEAREALVRYGRANKELKIQKQEAQRTAAEWKDKLDEATPQENRLDALQEELQKTEEEVKNHENQFLDTFEEKNRLHAKQRELKDQLDAIEQTLQDISVEHAKLETKRKRLAEKRQDALHQKNEALAAVTDAENDKTVAEQRCEDQRAEVATFTEQATSICDRVRVDRSLTKETLEAWLGKNEREILRAREKLGGDRQELLNKSLTAQKKYKLLRAHYMKIRSISQLLKVTREERIHRWRKFRTLISTAAQLQFTFMLAHRRFRGQMKLRHLEKMLDVSIEPDITRISEKGRQTKTLSGGEKSYSTICLLLALWEAMGSPIRCLDEFDVFMDQINRNVVVDMIIEGARRSGNRQFILISPQSMGGDISKQPDVKLIRFVF